MAYTFQSLVNRRRLTTSSFRFLDLPAELRNQIYDLVCADVAKMNVPLVRSQKTLVQRVKKTLTLGQHEASVLSLLLVNRQIHSETAGYVYPELQATLFEIRSNDLAKPSHLAAVLAGDRIPNDIDQLSSLVQNSPRFQCITQLSVHGLDNLFMLIYPKELEVGRKLVERGMVGLKGDLNKAKDALKQVGSMLPKLRSLHVEDRNLEQLVQVKDKFYCMSHTFVGQGCEQSRLRLAFPKLRYFTMECASFVQNYRFSKSHGRWRSLAGDRSVFDPSRMTGETAAQIAKDHAYLMDMVRIVQHLWPLLWN